MEQIVKLNFIDYNFIYNIIFLKEKCFYKCEKYLVPKFLFIKDYIVFDMPKTLDSLMKVI